MSDVVVEQAHNLAPEAAKLKIADFEEMMKKYGVKANWKGNSAELKGTGVSGSIEVTSSKVKVVVKLGMMARAVGVDATKLQGSITRRLKEAFEG